VTESDHSYQAVQRHLSLVSSGATTTAAKVRPVCLSRPVTK
jgi:hypothetical protein